MTEPAARRFSPRTLAFIGGLAVLGGGIAFALETGSWLAIAALAALSMPRLFGESTAHFQTYVRAWCAMTLDRLPGWPLWEAEAFELLHLAFSDLGVLYLQFSTESAEVGGAFTSGRPIGDPNSVICSPLAVDSSESK